MCNLFVFFFWMLLFLKYCYVDYRMSSNFWESDFVVVLYLVCDKKEYEGNLLSWFVNFVKIDLLVILGNKGYVCFEDSKVGY